MYARRVRLCPTQRVGLNDISLLKTLPAAIYVARFSAKSARARVQRRKKTIAAINIFSTRRKSARAHNSLLTRLTTWAKQP